jgi:hypothetical protein
LGGSTFWQIISTIVSVVLGILIDKAIKGKWPSRLRYS